MLGHLIRKEMLDHLLGFRFLILSALGSLIIWLSIYDGYAYYQERLKDYRKAQAATEARIREIVDVKDRSEIYENWSEIATIGYLVHKPPISLSIFARGLEPTLGKTGVLRPRLFAQQLKRSPVAADPILGLFPPLDLNTVVQVVLSLFALLLTYDAVCGEKEAGTLRLIASFPVPRHQLLLGKFFGALIPTLTAFGLPAVLGIAVVSLSPAVKFTGHELNRLGLILIAFVLYLATFICAGLLTSCLTRRAATSFVLLLGFWVATVTVIPRLSLIAANSLRPAISVHELQAQKTALMDVSYAESSEERRKWRREHPNAQDTLEGREAYSIFFSQVRKKAMDHDRPLLRRLDETFQNHYNARLDLAVAFARFSPAFALENAAVRLAGAGLERHWRFGETLEQHVERQVEWHNRTKDLDFLKVARPEKYGKYQWNASDMPRFAYQDIWPDEDIKTALVDIGVLALWGLVFFAGTWVSMLRYDLR